MSSFISSFFGAMLAVILVAFLYYKLDECLPERPFKKEKKEKKFRKEKKEKE